MIRKLFFRLLAAGAAMVFLVVTVVGLVTWLALMEPGFYTELRTQSLSPDERRALVERFEQTGEGLVRWRAMSLARQKPATQSAQGEWLQALGGAAPYDPAKDTRALRITEQELNALLADKAMDPSGDLRDPRVRLTEGRFELGVELANSGVECVFSAILEPTLGEDGTLRLEIVTARVGRLTLPLDTLLAWLPEPVVYSGHDAEIDLTPPAPHLKIKSLAHSPRTPRVKSIVCREGELVVEFSAPVLPDQNRKQAAAVADAKESAG
ncbi:hypothetical protein Mal64_33090 [Pseudobythopirellula maris]|uniref:DUF2993 domain-containing protein n=1 Tax=Pseudobythopirellula maris TaxID=2527991 RepID=A0A5C5ZGP1_9BACT|nr:hypothetical protein [Pseudobythopirellula maris]TWT86484.1 hypothetical protein Mal64_33090 [Pseudobythopirellula maris]